MERRIRGVLSPKASGSITITENGNYDVVDVANAIVNVVPEEVGGITPEGSITLTSNGVYDVTMYAEAVVDVENVIPEGYVKPSGTLNVTSNGTFDVTEKKNVSVNVASSGGEDRLKKLLDATESCTNMFNTYPKESIGDLLQYSDTENVDNMSEMFSSCTRLTTIPLLNTSKVTTMASMFTGCSNLITIPQLNTSNVTTMVSMFSGCQSLTSIPQLDTSKVTKMNSIFSGCTNLEIVDITHYNINNSSYGAKLVNNATNLKAFIIRSFGTSYVINTDTFSGSGIANGTGYNYVPRAMVDTLKSATNWSTYASQIRALEDYTKDGTTTGELDLAKMGLV